MYDGLTPEQQDIKRAAREFAEKEFQDIARDLDEREEFDDRIWKKAGEARVPGRFYRREIRRSRARPFRAVPHYRRVRPRRYGRCPVHGGELFRHAVD